MIPDFFARGLKPGPHPLPDFISGKLIHIFAVYTKRKIALFSVFIVFAGISFIQPVMAQPAKSESHFTIENYYKIKWGFAEEFINLWKVNHYPLLKKAIEKGDIISVTAEKPLLHSGEDTRWDLK